MKVTWEFGEPVSEGAINELEKSFKVQLPQLYKEIVLKNNGANPTPDCWDIPNGEEGKVFDCLLSVSADDKYNVYTVYDALKNEFDITNLLPFAEDGFGNSICFELSDMSIVYFDHDICDDDYKGTRAADSFESFLELLYEDE